ncbi:ABC-F family ATP-binding cassette domain-containing protein [Candidatus Saccharibacteria bacterium]|nr:ABC-F family ATP-binding cassette domain-containing protein [Candidatus Saccharibacteria bacterium]
MIADVHITEKSFGSKTLMKDVRFWVNDGDKIGIIGRNGVGKSTLFSVLAGTDTDFTGDINFKRGASVLATAQEHHDVHERSVLAYILEGLPEYKNLKDQIDTLPLTMGDDMRQIDKYTQALERFDDKGFYEIEERVAEELKRFGLLNMNDRAIGSLSGGQKRLVEIVKVMHADADLALIDEPTNHMDFVAKEQFISWVKSAHRQAMLIVTHDRDVLKEVDKIVELKDDGTSMTFDGNYDAYLKQNAHTTAAGMNDFENTEKRKTNLKQKIIDYQRLKEKSRNPGTIQKFKRLEQTSRAELAELERKEKPTFWIDKDSVAQLDYKSAANYDKLKAKNIRLQVKDYESETSRVLVRAVDISLGYEASPLFKGVHFELREGEALELRGRNGAGKTTLLAYLLQGEAATASTRFSGEAAIEPHTRVGVYEQEIASTYLSLPLEDAIEKMYLDRDLSIGDTKIRRLLSDYLFTDGDRQTPLSRLSGGQKARFQIIAMLANDPQLLVLDEPTNHLDLPSIEELESALSRYSGAVLYVSHDAYFQSALGGQVITIG